MLRLLGLGLLLLAPPGEACTNIAVSGGATKDGSAMVAHTDDSGPLTGDLRLVRVPDMHHAPGSKRSVYYINGGYPRIVSKERGPEYAPVNGQPLTVPMGHIPQVPFTYGYWDQDYGLMNTVGLGIAETTCGAKTVGWPSTLSYGYNMFSIRELSKVALERCKTARCAVKTMGYLAVKYGFYGDDSGPPDKPVYIGSSEALSIADRDGEAWVFHVMTGEKNASAIWAAQRVPKGEVAAIANAFIIRKMDLSDTANYLASDNVHEVAKRNGWWDPKKGEFDFTAAYAPAENPMPTPLYVGRRLWRIFDILAPSLKLDPRLGFEPKFPTYPFSVKPDSAIDAHTIMGILRDYYEGTAYDLTKGVAAGPFGNPVRYSGNKVGGGWERPISIFRCLYSFVAVSRPKQAPLSGLLWYGHDAPHGTVYVPIFTVQESIPKSYLEGMQSEYNPKSAWWAFNFVNNWVQLKFSYMQKEVVAEQKRWEHEASNLVAHVDAEAAKLIDNPSKMKRYIEEKTVPFADEVIESRWKLAHKLIAKYSNGNIVLSEEETGGMVIPGYPLDWIQTTNFVGWPGDSWAGSAPQTTTRNVPDQKTAQHPEGGMVSVQLLLPVTFLVAAVAFMLGISVQSVRSSGYQPIP